MIKNTIIKLLVSAAAVFILLMSCATNDSSDTKDETSGVYRIIAVPDTQHYVEDPELNKIFKIQIDWIMENIDDLNIVFVTHLGDVVDTAEDQQQWNYALDSLQGLFNADDDFPYSICQGNHDVSEIIGEENTKFAEYFGPERYEGKSWYVGASPNGLNHAQIFNAGKRKFLHINLRYNPDTPDFEWAQSIIDDKRYNGLPTILSTHNYVIYGGRSPEGQFIWDDFIRKNSQIFMTINGHTHTEYSFVSHNDAGKPVYQILTDYQDRPNGGNGLLRIFTFDENKGTIKSQTFTPGYSVDYKGGISLPRGYEMDGDSEFTIKTNLIERFDPDSAYDWGEEPAMPKPPEPDKIKEPGTHIFQQRLNDYTGTLNTQININYPDRPFSGAGTLTTDLDDGGAQVESLLMFSEIIGTGKGQIPPGAKVKSAKLLLNVTSHTDGTISAYRMLEPWSEGSTWNDYLPAGEIIDIETNGAVKIAIEADGTEAHENADVLIKAPFDIPHVIDVTESVQAWADGEDNFGWVFINNSGDGWDWMSSYGTNPPALAVVIEGFDIINK